MMNSWRKIKLFFRKFFLVNDTPHKVAAGAALGIFLGIVPGEGLITSLILASLFRFNRLSTVAALEAANMWTTFLLLPIAASVGGFLFGDNYQDLIDDFNQTYHLGYRYFFSKIVFVDLVLPLIAGFFIVAGAIALIVYFILLFLLKRKKISSLNSKIKFGLHKNK